MTDFVKAKKHLGQHFLKDNNIAQKIAESLIHTHLYQSVLEVGPGTGVLTRFLLERGDLNLSVIDIDTESIDYLKKHFPALEGKIIEGDFLKLDLSTLFSNQPFAVAGNFPYNISSQILFKVLEHRNLVPEVVGMFQKEVAERIAAPPGSKTYGVISVILQAFYDIEYLFTVSEHVFIPPPKVKSAVIRLTRNSTQTLACDEGKFINVVKAAFNQRRKTLRNALKVLGGVSAEYNEHPFLDKRAETLSVKDFVELTNMIYGV